MKMLCWVNYLIKSLGVTYVIIGHSERRNYKHEINIDFIKEHQELHEIKKSKAIEEAGIWQVKYYLYYLKQRGVKGLTAKIDYPMIKKILL